MKGELLEYTIADCSSYSPNYPPEAILEDLPTEQSSRWSSAINDQNQFISLHLEHTSLINTITFGKFHKSKPSLNVDHVCNLKEFKVFVKNGKCDSWFEVLHGGLNNDSEPETFPLSYPKWHPSRSNVPIPAEFVKVVPLASWGNSFNFSIWYIELRGSQNPTFIGPTLTDYDGWITKESWKLCLKFIREQEGMQKVFKTLKDQLGLTFENSLVTELWEQVNKGNYTLAESLLSLAFQEKSDIFNEHIRNAVEYKPIWEKIEGDQLNGNGVEEGRMDVGNASWPSARGGHQMVLDPHSNSIYLLGGWDGHSDLGDFWKYSINEKEWTCLSNDTRKEGGPGARSCHKMIIFTTLRRIYVLGRYVENEARSQETVGNNDFYYYDIDKHIWTCVMSDVASRGGPPLVYDHQMSIDEAKGIIHVFGGRIISLKNSTSTNSPTNETSYSGLYSFDITSGQWKLLRSDDHPLPSTPNIHSRIGHSMIFNPTQRQLYILAGQRHKDYLCDMYVYDVDSEMVVEAYRDTSKLGGPEPGLTQRATIDPEVGEIFLFTGIVKERQSTAASSPNTTNTFNQGPLSHSDSSYRNNLWIYDILEHTWRRIPTATTNTNQEPQPRFAHQLVYHHATRTHYLFGGNPGETGNPRKRLNDLWQLKLIKTNTPADILRHLCFLLRKQQFFEMCYNRRLNNPSSNMTSPTMLDAMHFLQQEIAQTVDHSREEESREFRSLSSWLLTLPSEYSNVTASRINLFYQIVSFLPRDMQPPHKSIANAIL